VTFEHLCEDAVVPCGWKHRGRKCRAEPTVQVRDLGPSYGKLRLQPVCALHASKGYVPRNPYVRRNAAEDRDT
jgi:hypothetical protein